jgi:hypothetical protein
MSEIADISVAPTPRLSRTSFQHVPVHSVDACIEIVGAAIVRHVFGNIGVATARQKAQTNRRARLHGAFFQSVVYAHEFSEFSIKKTYPFAEVLGLDPNDEVAAAYAKPEIYFQACKRHSIDVLDHVRRRLGRSKLTELVDEISGKRALSAKSYYVDELRKSRDDIGKHYARSRSRQKLTHPSGRRDRYDGPPRRRSCRRRQSL